MCFSRPECRCGILMRWKIVFQQKRFHSEEKKIDGFELDVGRQVNDEKINLNAESIANQSINFDTKKNEEEKFTEEKMSAIQSIWKRLSSTSNIYKFSS